MSFLSESDPEFTPSLNKALSSEPSPFFCSFGNDQNGMESKSDLTQSRDPLFFVEDRMDPNGSLRTLKFAEISLGIERILNNPDHRCME